MSGNHLGITKYSGPISDLTITRGSRADHGLLISHKEWVHSGRPMIRDETIFLATLKPRANSLGPAIPAVHFDIQRKLSPKYSRLADFHGSTRRLHPALATTTSSFEDYSCHRIVYSRPLRRYKLD